MTILEINTVSISFQSAKKALDELKPVLDKLDTIYNAAGGAKSTITQAGLDGVPSFSGLTKQQLDDGLFALTSGIRTAITNSYTALAQLAARA